MANYAELSKKWFQSLSTPRRKTRIPQSRTGLEALEQRLLLTVEAFIDAEQTLQISGTEDDDRIVATVDSDSQEITIGASDEDGSNLARFSLKDFRRIELDAADGNDFVNIVDANGTLDHREVVLQLSGGEGDNIVFLSTAPVDEINIKRFQQLSEASVELGDIARQIAATTQGGLLEESKHVIADASTRIVDLSAVLTAQAQDELITPGGELLDESQSELLTTAQVLLTEIEDIGARASRLENEMDAQVETQQDTEKRLTSSATQDHVGATGEQLDELSEALAAQGEVFAARGESIGDAGQVTGDGLDRLEETGQQILDGSARDLELAAESLAARAEQLEQAGAQLNADAEIRLASVGQNVLRIAERLEGVNRLLEAAFGSFTKDLTEAAQRMTPAKDDHGMCEVTPTHTFNGGSGFDFFFPLSAPTSSWLINGGAGTDVLFGGFAADAINGGDGTDFIFGLRGDDVIHGDDGIDFLFGEFLVDLPGITGNDCVFGDADIDLVVGDNGFEIGFSNPGGDDHLHGGSEIDIVIGDDISDIFDPAHAGGSDVMYGDEGIDALFGTGGDDTMEGGEQIDVMMGGGDNDTMYGIDNTFTGDGWTIPGTTIVIGNLQFGNLGNDTIYGGDGIDVQFGNDNDDKMYGKDYIDIMFGNADEDTMYGESGGEIFDIYGVPVRLGNLMFGGPANDEMWGGGDLDVMFGNGENDTMHGYDGNFELFGIDADVMFGNDGNDIMDGDAEELILFTSSDVMFGGDGADTMEGGKQSDLMFGGNGEDTMRGDSNSILLVASTDVMFGGSDNDTMDGGNSTDIMFGNDGHDNMLGDDESALLLSPDVMFGGNGNDSMNGGANSDLMFGNAGDDNMLGDSNVVWFVASTDVMFGNSGNDFMDGGNNTDLMFGNSGSDDMHGDNNSFGLLSADVMFGGSENDEMNGGNSSDGMFGGSGNDTMLGDSNLWWQLLSTDLMFGNSGCDQMFGGSSNDLMFGNSGVDMMNGQGLLDIMYGNSETDVMSGGNGSDLMFGNGGPDQINGNDGWDMIYGNSGDDRISGDNGWDLLFGNSGNDQIQGGNGWDLIYGNSGNDCLDGNNGWDMIFGNSGDDCIAGGNGWDMLYGNSGNDHLLGDNGSDILFGNSGNDNLEGGNGWDVIFGNSGNDNLWGGAGVDTLYGNSGNDNLWGGSGWPDLLFGGWGSDNTTQGGPDSSGITCVCVLAPLEPCVKFDFGDAPDSYGTTLTTGARHVIAGPRLGNRVDWELDGQPTAAANGDDMAVTDDEDGVTISTLFAGAGTSVPVDLQNASNAFLNVWVDTDTTSDFSGSGEHVVVDYPLVSGSNLVNIALPATALPGTSFARFRVSTTGGLNETGVANDGEVEDYQIKIVGMDFGDAPVSYGTVLANNGARHFIGGPVLGATIDAEADGQPSVNADGDDLTGIDDEDGVILSGMVAGTVGTAFVTLGSPGSAYLDAWVDFNADGDFFDPGEQILTSTPITGSMSLPFTVPVNATTGATYSRFRVSTMGGLAPIGAAQNGEVEDHRGYIKPAPKMDFGDAPDSYQTLRSNDGPRHIVGGPVLGTLIDAEADGQPSFGAFLDNATGLFDEDGVALSGMVAGGTATANVFLSNALSAYVDAWVDFNQDGVFDNSAGSPEIIFSSQPILTGTNSLSFPVPSSALSGGTYARFRVSTTGGLAPTTPEIGPAPFGEVEDHRTSIEPQQPSMDFGDAPESLGYRTWLANNGARHTLGGPFLGTLIDAELDGQPSVNADGDDLGGIDDEDGVILSGMVAGTVGTAFVTLGSPGSAYLDAWVDFNADGDFTDAGEQILTSTPITGSMSLPFTVPVNATTGATYSRFRVSTMGGLAPIGAAQNGEVEDHRGYIKPAPKMDFGDAPDSYQTLRSNDGPRHIVGGPVLGTLIDAEADGQPSFGAFLDNATGLFDEDGVALSGMVAGGTATANVFLSNALSAYVDAWVDFNQDGVFDNSAGSPEIIFSSQPILTGTNSLSFPVPSSALSGGTYARFRVSTTGGLAPTTPEIGPAPFGEVEDHRTSIEPQQPSMDFGDAPESLGYRTWLANNGARHTLGGPFLGTLIDAELDGQPSVNADGDDLGGIDDEDGVILSGMVAGGTTTANVFLSNALSAYLDAWVDFNADGDFTDAGEQIFTSEPIATGLNPLNFPVPSSATTGSTYTRFRVSSWGGLAPTGLSQRGEVEDYRIDIESPSEDLDYGDLPDDDAHNYPTLLANDGARHASGGPVLGSKFDTEPDGQPSPDADADDINVSDDEDGITNGAYSLALGGTVDVTIQTTGGASSAVLDAWIDFNQDGIFDNTSGSAEIIFNSQSIMNGTTTQTFSVPTGATLGNTYARFRVTDSGFPHPGQYGGPGEVEDYKIYVKQQIGGGGDVQFLFGGVKSDSASQQEGTAAKDLRGNQTSTDSIEGQADLEAIRNNGGEKSQVELRNEATGDRVTAVGPTPAQFLEVYELDQRLELTLTENLFEDWGGLNEKWLHGEEGWYFITPDGNLYRWDGSSNATGDIVASLPVSFYSDPEQLCEARADSTTTVDDDIARFTAANLDYDLKLESDGNYSTNWGGEGEKWIRGTEGWYFITPTGSLYQWTRGAGMNGDLIADLDSRYHADPTLLTEALQSLSADEAAYAVDHGLNLYVTPSDHFNWGGRNEKWMKGDSGWYFITEDGSFYSWDGKPTASGTLISRLSSKYYADLSLLAATPSTGQPDVDNLLDDIFEDLGDLLQI